MGWKVVWRGIHSMRGEQWLDENFPGNLNIRYNGGERADYNPLPGVVYSRIVQNEKYGYYTAEVWV